jgi:hypothetical protein
LKALIPLAVALTAISATTAIVGGDADPARAADPEAGRPAAVPLSGSTAAVIHEQRLRRRVATLTHRARRHSRRLGLRPGAVADVPKRDALLARRERRLETVVDFLAGRREVRRAVDERPSARLRPGGRTVAARVRRQHSIVVRRSLRLGVDRPGRLRPASTREGRLAQLRHWRAVARYLRAQSERVRPRERPLSRRVPHYAELMCIAGHESHATWDISTGNGYYGGLQMDRGFQQTYAPELYRTKGTADNWTPEEQMQAAERAIRTRGFTPWPNTARTCGLL